MRKNRWSYHDNLDAWDYSWELRFTDYGNSAIEKSIHISGLILELFHKYQMVCFFPPEVSKTKGISWITDSYKNNAREFFKHNPSAFRNMRYTNFSLDVWKELGKFIKDNKESYHNAMTKLCVFNKTGNICEKYRGTNFFIVKQAFYPGTETYEISNSSPINLSFGFPVGQHSCLFVSLNSQCDIWFEEINDSNFYEENEDGSRFDNRVLAYRNTPKVNSLIKSLNLLGDKFGAEYKFNNEELDLSYVYPEYLDPSGILLDGKIIYQEDIEEGRIKLPE